MWGCYFDCWGAQQLPGQYHLFFPCLQTHVWAKGTQTRWHRRRKRGRCSGRQKDHSPAFRIPSVVWCQIYAPPALSISIWCWRVCQNTVLFLNYKCVSHIMGFPPPSAHIFIISFTSEALPLSFFKLLFIYPEMLLEMLTDVRVIKQREVWFLLTRLSLNRKSGMSFPVIRPKLNSSSFSMGGAGLLAYVNLCLPDVFNQALCVDSLWMPYEGNVKKQVIRVKLLMRWWAFFLNELLIYCNSLVLDPVKADVAKTLTDTNYNEERNMSK